MNTLINSYLDYIKKEILEDILLFSPSYASILFYNEKEDGLHFASYEIADAEEPTLEATSDSVDRLIFEHYEKAKEEGRLVPGLSNEIFEGESYKIMPLKDLLKTILKIQNPNFSNESITIIAYQMINLTSSYKLAKIIGISKQAMSQFLLGQRPLPERIKKEISIVLKIDCREFTEEIEQFLFDESDL